MPKKESFFEEECRSGSHEFESGHTGFRSGSNSADLTTPFKNKAMDGEEGSFSQSDEQKAYAELSNVVVNENKKCSPNVYKIGLYCKQHLEMDNKTMDGSFSKYNEQNAYEDLSKIEVGKKKVGINEGLHQSSLVNSNYCLLANPTSVGDGHQVAVSILTEKARKLNWGLIWKCVACKPYNADLMYICCETCKHKIGQRGGFQMLQVP